MSDNNAATNSLESINLGALPFRTPEDQLCAEKHLKDMA